MPPQNNQPNPNDPANTPGPNLPSPMPPSGQAAAPTPQQPQPVHQDYPQSSNAMEPKDPENRYAFFMESKPKQKNPLIAATKSASSFTLIIGGAVALLIILGLAAVLFSVFGNNKTESTANLTGIIHEQQEIIRITGLADEKVQGTDVANFVATANVSTLSSQQKFIDFANAHGNKIKAKDLEKYVANPQTDIALDAAEAASTYDSTLSHLMSGLLSDYQSDLNKLSAQITSTEGKTLIEQSVADVSLLKTMLPPQQ